MKIYLQNFVKDAYILQIEVGFFGFFSKIWILVAIIFFGLKWVIRGFPTNPII